MGRNAICKVCHSKLNTDNAIKAVYNNKNNYFCNVDEMNQWINEQNKIKADFEQWCSLYEFIKTEVMHYKKEQKLPKYLVDRLQNLRNGTIIGKGVGKIAKSKEGYDYIIILETFKRHNKDIQYWIMNKSFENERQQINYIMAIIDNNINNVYNRILKEKQLEKVETNTSNIDNITIMNVDVAVNKNTNKAIDLSSLL